MSDVIGVTARRMLDALIAGERDVDAMAEMALTRMRPRIPELRLALEGRFDDHHALMLSMHLGHIDQLSVTIEQLDNEVDRGVSSQRSPLGIGSEEGAGMSEPRVSFRSWWGSTGQRTARTRCAGRRARPSSPLRP